MTHFFHRWKRVCWIFDMWRQADQHEIAMQPITDYGWQINNDSLTIDWGCESNMKTVRERVAGLLKGCNCKIGCRTWQCGCRKNEKKCSEGCHCNEPVPEESDELALEEDIGDGPSSESIDDIMDWVFGDHSIDSRSEGEYGEENTVSDEDGVTRFYINYIMYIHPQHKHNAVYTCFFILCLSFMLYQTSPDKSV